tara:strand:+ start:477 stop:707 length:231 start_codon:yes stop_codon:yes gene_type:complete
LAVIGFFQSVSATSHRYAGGVVGLLIDIMSLLTVFTPGLVKQQLPVPHFSKLNLLPCSYGFFHWCLAWWTENPTSL